MVVQHQKCWLFWSQKSTKFGTSWRDWHHFCCDFNTSVFALTLKDIYCCRKVAKQNLSIEKYFETLHVLTSGHGLWSELIVCANQVTVLLESANIRMQFKCHTQFGKVQTGWWLMTYFETEGVYMSWFERYSVHHCYQIRSDIIRFDCVRARAEGENARALHVLFSKLCDENWTVVETFPIQSLLRSKNVLKKTGKIDVNDMSNL